MSFLNYVFDDRFSSLTILVEAKLIFVEKVLSSTLILQLILFVPHRSKKTHQQTTTDDGFKQYVQVLHILKSHPHATVCKKDTKLSFLSHGVEYPASCQSHFSTPLLAPKNNNNHHKKNHHKTTDYYLPTYSFITT